MTQTPNHPDPGDELVDFELPVRLEPRDGTRDAREDDPRHRFASPVTDDAGTFNRRFDDRPPPPRLKRSMSLGERYFAGILAVVIMAFICGTLGVISTVFLIPTLPFHSVLLVGIFAAFALVGVFLVIPRIRKTLADDERD